MMRVGELSLVPVWVNPGHLMATARILMAGHSLRAIGVMSADDLVGILPLVACRPEFDTDLVSAHMISPGETLQADTLVNEAAGMFAEKGLDYAPVVSRATFLGILTSQSLLRELKRSWDPLTNLGWDDRLREWGMENLAQGREITIIFVDLDKFGQYNKQFGHEIGDAVLKQISRMLLEATDRSVDILVRYGGDEFAIGTLRPREEAEQMARDLENRVAQLTVPGVDRPVTFSTGVAGGRRTEIRENIHASATVSDIINLASQASQARKNAKDGLGEPQLVLEQSPGSDSGESPFRRGTF